jgi:hypothetical protein
MLRVHAVKRHGPNNRTLKSAISDSGDGIRLAGMGLKGIRLSDVHSSAVGGRCPAAPVNIHHISFSSVTNDNDECQPVSPAVKFMVFLSGN